MSVCLCPSLPFCEIEYSLSLKSKVKVKAYVNIRGIRADRIWHKKLKHEHSEFMIS